MDGYTVEEAASVLGVPRERVWELLARGIITGSADLGGAMRVRLKAEPAAVPAPTPVDRPADAGYAASTEVTPFRELLTEFRSLTERYGQALLALGEARGEVAGLRSRVDLLEARVDLRLPSSAAPISSSWSSTPWPTPTERVVQPPPMPSAEAAPAEDRATTPDHEEAATPAAHDEDAGSHRRKGRAARRATERFADALARAEDPSLPELPGAEETAAALAALRQEHPSAAAPEPESDRDTEASLPRELPSADQVPVADEEEAAPEVTATAEDERAAAEPAGEPVQATVAPVEPIAEAELEPEPRPEPQAEPEVEPTPVAASVGDGEGVQGDSGSEIEWDQERYSAAIEEPDWISTDEPDGPAAWRQPREPEPPSAWSPPPDPEPPEDTAPAESVAQAPDADEPPADEPAWRSSRAEERSEAPTAIHIESSGSRELDEGLAALDALVNPQPSADDAGDAWKSAVEREAQPIGAPRPQAWVRPSPPPQLTTRSSASRAYRRLRRIFPT